MLNDHRALKIVLTALVVMAFDEVFLSANDANYTEMQTSIADNNAALARAHTESHGPFSLGLHRVGPLWIGMSLNDIYNAYPKGITKQVDLQAEGNPTSAVQVFLGKNKKSPSLTLLLEGPNNTVDRIVVDDLRFKTASGIGIGSTLGQLRSAYHGVVQLLGNDPITAYVDELKMSFGADFSMPVDSTGNVVRLKTPDDPVVPDQTKITDVEVID